MPGQPTGTTRGPCGYRTPDHTTPGDRKQPSAPCLAQSYTLGQAPHARPARAPVAMSRWMQHNTHHGVHSVAPGHTTILVKPAHYELLALTQGRKSPNTGTST